MKLQTSSQVNFLDILFKYRNKNYGAYELRLHYADRTYKAIGFTVLLTATFFASIYTLNRSKRGSDISRLILHPTVITEIVLPKIIAPPPPAPPAQGVPHQNIKTDAFTVPKIVIDKPDLPAIIPPKGEIAGTKVTEPGPSGTGVPDGTKTGATIAPVTPAATELPKTWVEQMPDFKGDLKSYLSSHLQYPELARTNNISGKVIVQFVINEDGSVSNAKVLKGIGGGCDEEALRVVSNMPSWKPGKQNGKAVKVYFTLPVVFLLQ